MPVDSDLLSTGLTYHQTGQFAEAQAVYRQLLAAEPHNDHVLSLLGAVCINLGQWPEAAQYLQQALARNPNHAAARENLGVWLARQGRFAEAVDQFQRAIALGSHGPQTYHNLANALMRVGRHADAVEAFRHVVQLAPHWPRAQGDLAKVLLELGRPAEAVPHFRQAARLQLNDARPQFELAAVLASQGQLDEAIAAYRDVLRLNPSSAEALVNLASAAIAKGDYVEAQRCAAQAVQMRPLFAEAHLNLGSALTKLERYAEAITALEEAARLKPELPQTYNNLGIALVELGRFDEAIAQYERALNLSPHNADARYNWGIALHKRGEPSRAIEQFDRALALRPDYAEAHHNRAAALLLSGRLAEGFEAYEWRFRSRDFPPFRPRWPLWDGSSLAGRTIVLCGEQGFGDTLQFIRYSQLLADAGARVIVECHPALHRICRGTPGVSQFITPAEPPPAADCCVAMMSLPRRSQTTLETVPAQTPYLFADEILVAQWRERLAVLEGFKIGIAWQGNPRCPGDAQRSMPLAHFEPLARLPGVRLISLQKGPGVEQLAPLADAWRVVDFGPALDSESGAFMDTAAIMRGLDLVITSDTSLAHLAGGLGVPVWVALQRVPDWRWLLDRADCPWYPTMRLFRQPSFGDWAGVFAEMAEEVGRAGH